VCVCSDISTAGTRARVSCIVIKSAPFRRPHFSEDRIKRKHSRPVTNRITAIPRKKLPLSSVSKRCLDNDRLSYDLSGVPPIEKVSVFFVFSFFQVAANFGNRAPSQLTVLCIVFPEFAILFTPRRFYGQTVTERDFYETIDGRCRFERNSVRLFSVAR